jgi:hypothetical protein
MLVFLLIIYVTGRNLSNAYTDKEYESLGSSTSTPVKNWDTQFNYTDSLMAMYGMNKIIPEEYKNQIILALAHYPELRNSKIQFVVEEALIPISSRPKPSTLFYSKANRWYCIVISSGSMESMEEALLKNLSFNSQVGVIGHELGHTVYYKDKSSFHLIGVALAYPFDNFRMKFEKETDIRTIEHGLGWQLFQWADELRPPGKSNTFLDTYYLNPNEIKSRIDKSSLYKLEVSK